MASRIGQQTRVTATGGWVAGVVRVPGVRFAMAASDDIKEYIYISWWWVVLAAFLLGGLVGTLVA